MSWRARLRTFVSSDQIAGATARRLLSATLGERLPLTDGTLQTQGLDGEVVIRRDRHHVPHITAVSERDAGYAMGFAQGQDRGFQLRLYARLAAGRLAELVGEDGVELDRLSRRLGFGHRAPAQVAAQRPRVREILTSFARGVTDGMTRGLPAAPHEFALLRATPQPHTPADVVATMSLFSFLLAMNWEVELARLYVLAADGEQALLDLDPSYAAHHPVTSPPGAAAGAAAAKLHDSLGRLRGVVGVQGASNNWALAQHRTTTGRVLVANDPHLPALLPSMWYLAHLETPEWSVAGAAFTGTPLIAAGHNGHGAWGVTAGYTDSTDLFIEELEGTKVRESDGWSDAEVRQEAIRVKGGSEVVETVVTTPRGPVIGPALEGDHDGLSIAGTWMDTDRIAGFFDLPAARSFDDVREAFTEWSGLHLNVVWGDVDGHIGWQLAGTLPRRLSEEGMIPLPGWHDDVGWSDERVTGRDLPWTLDPAEGVLATANNQPVPHSLQDDGPGDRPFLGYDWFEGYRQAAILDGLAERETWDVDSTQHLQVDNRSLPWREIRATVLGADVDTDPAARLGQQMLRRWDGRVDADSPGASVYELAMAGLTRRMVEARAPRSARWLLGASAGPFTEHSIVALRHTARLVELLTARPDGWFDDWDAAIRDALGDAVRQLRRGHGDDPEGWAWGRVRGLVFRHPAAASSAVAAAVFDRGPIPWGGDTHTVNQCSPAPCDPTGDPIGTATMRMVVDVGAWERSRWVLAGGQSGNPLSPHYDDQLELWQRAAGIPIPWSEAEVSRATVATLRLVPRS